MTLILGACCEDGVVMVGDSKITAEMGTLIKYEPKVAAEFRNIIFGYAGAVDMFQVFRRYIVGDAVILRDSSQPYEFDNILEKIGDIMKVLLEARSRQYFKLDVMVGRLYPAGMKPDINIVNNNSKIIPIDTWKAIGKGEVFAYPILRNKWNNSLTTREFAQLGYDTIKYIDDKNLNDTVGGEPWIRYLQIGAQTDTVPSIHEKAMFESSYSSFRDTLDNDSELQLEIKKIKDVG